MHESNQNIKEIVCMITPNQQKIRDKTITAKQWADMVKTGDWIIPGSVAANSTVCMEELGLRLGEDPGQVKDIEIWSQIHVLPMYNIFKMDPEEEYHVLHDFFFFPAERLEDLEASLVGAPVGEVEQTVARFYAEHKVESPGVTPADFAQVFG